MLHQLTNLTVNEFQAEKKQVAAQLIDEAKSRIAENKLTNDDFVKLYAHTLDVTPEVLAKSERLEKSIVAHVLALRPHLCPSIKQDTLTSIDSNAHYQLVLASDKTTLLLGVSYRTLSWGQVAEVASSYQAAYGKQILFSLKSDNTMRTIYFNLSHFISSVLPVLNGLKDAPLRPNRLPNKILFCDPGSLRFYRDAISRIFSEDISKFEEMNGSILVSHADCFPKTLISIMTRRTAWKIKIRCQFFNMRFCKVSKSAKTVNSRQAR
jgi:hypothetical protein